MTALLLMLACSDHALSGAEAADRGDDSALDGSDTATEQDEAELWSLSAELELVDGVPTSGTFTIELVGDETAAPCSLPDSLPITVGASPHPVIYSWFSAPLLPHAGAGCDALPKTVWIGLGALDETLEASMPTAGIETDVGAGLNGAYLSEDDGETIWVFGVAGPESAYVGGGASATDASEMDGLWSIVPVFDLPLP
jgi:hypothetical protein